MLRSPPSPAPASPSSLVHSFISRKMVWLVASRSFQSATVGHLTFRTFRGTARAARGAPREAVQEPQPFGLVEDPLGTGDLEQSPRRARRAHDGEAMSIVGGTAGGTQQRPETSRIEERQVAKVKDDGLHPVPLQGPQVLVQGRGSTQIQVPLDHDAGNPVAQLAANREILS